MEHEYKSRRSQSKFIVNGTRERAYLIAEGEAAANVKVQRQIEQVRVGGGDFSTVDWIARQMANTY